MNSFDVFVISLLRVSLFKSNTHRTYRFYDHRFNWSTDVRTNQSTNNYGSQTSWCRPTSPIWCYPWRQHQNPSSWALQSMHCCLQGCIICNTPTNHLRNLDVDLNIGNTTSTSTLSSPANHYILHLTSDVPTRHSR